MMTGEEKPSCEAGAAGRVWGVERGTDWPGQVGKTKILSEPPNKPCVFISRRRLKVFVAR